MYVAAYCLWYSNEGDTNFDINTSGPGSGQTLGSKVPKVLVCLIFSSVKVKKRNKKVCPYEKR